MAALTKIAVRRRLQGTDHFNLTSASVKGLGKVMSGKKRRGPEGPLEVLSSGAAI
jgi:hypothetical protein